MNVTEQENHDYLEFSEEEHSSDEDSQTYSSVDDSYTTREDEYSSDEDSHIIQEDLDSDRL